MPHIHEGSLDGKGLRIGVAVARFNEFVTRKLHDGALAGLRDRGVADDDVHVAWVPGAYELGSACSGLFTGRAVDAVIALGAVIRGETSHYDYVCRAATDGVREAGAAVGRPAIFGVLTTDTSEQALARAGDGPGNKGYEAALGAIEMTRLLESLRTEEDRR